MQKNTPLAFFLWNEIGEHEFSHANCFIAPLRGLLFTSPGTPLYHLYRLMQHLGWIGSLDEVVP
jgi:hypothetical protein